jgi:hypothetical protein
MVGSLRAIRIPLSVSLTITVQGKLGVIPAKLVAFQKTMPVMPRFFSRTAWISFVLERISVSGFSLYALPSARVDSGRVM